VNATPSRLRIVHLVTEECGPQVPNGVTRAIFHLAAAQARIGHDVRVLPHEGTVHEDPADTRARPATLARIAQATCRVSPSLRENLIGPQPDIVHLHSIHVPENIAAAAALGRAGIPYCITVHGGLSPLARERRRWRKWAYRVVWEQHYLDKAAFIHALSPQEHLDLQEYGVRVPIVVAPNGVDPSWLPASTNARALRSSIPALVGRRVFLFVGRLDPNQKGLDLLIEAYAAARLEDAALLLVGPDWKEGRALLEGLRARCGVSDRVVFMGPVHGAEQADVIAAGDVFVHTSRWEGVSLAVLEAAAWRKPCLLTTAADPLNQLGLGGGAVVVQPTVTSIAGGLREMTAMSNERLCDMGARAHRVVTNAFTWSNAAARLVSAYREFAPSLARVEVA